MTLALALGPALGGCSDDGDDDPPDTTTQEQAEARDAAAWSAEARTAYSALQVTARDLPPRARAWLAGERSDAEFAADLAIAAGEVEQVRDAVRKLRAFPRDERVAPLYRSSAELYVEYVGLLQAAAATPPGDLRVQLDLAARRVRILADRIFDRGQARLDPFLHEVDDPNVIIQLPPEVPDWRPDGMAAGPPLDDPPPPASSTPALREEDRPTQSREAWATAVRAAGVPAMGELSAAVDAGAPVPLRDLARRYDAVARALQAVPDPAGAHGRDDAAQYRLALLTFAEAARAAQAGRPDIARRLAAVAADVAEVPGVTPAQ
jgi:hypothetical protein